MTHEEIREEIESSPAGSSPPFWSAFPDSAGVNGWCQTAIVNGMWCVLVYIVRYEAGRYVVQPVVPEGVIALTFRVRPEDLARY